MPNERGFKFEIRGEVFIKQASTSGQDVMAALQEAEEARVNIAEALEGAPATFTLSEPVQASRRVSDPDFDEVDEDDESSPETEQINLYEDGQ